MPVYKIYESNKMAFTVLLRGDRRISNNLFQCLTESAYLFRTVFQAGGEKVSIILNTNITLIAFL